MCIPGSDSARSPGKGCQHLARQLLLLFDLTDLPRQLLNHNTTQQMQSGKPLCLTTKSIESGMPLQQTRAEPATSDKSGTRYILMMLPC